MIKDDILQIILTVTVSAIAIVLFYFIYGAKLEGEIAKHECINIVKSYTKYYKAIFGFERSAACSKLDVDTDDAASKALDAEVEANNQKLYNTTYKAMGYGSAAALALFIMIWFIGKRPKTSINNMLYRTMLNLGAVLSVEYVFLTYIIGENISVDGNDVNKLAFESIYTQA